MHAVRFAPQQETPAKIGGGTKRKLAAVMNELDELVAAGEIHDGAYLRLANLLKATFDAEAISQRGHVLDFLVEQAFERPFSIADFYDWTFVESPDFLRALFAHAAQHFGGHKRVPALWLTDLVGAYLADFLFDPALGMLATVRVRLWLLLAVDHPPLLRTVERRLDELGATPATLFRDAEADAPATGLVNGPSAEEMMVQDARFARWLLRDATAFSDETVRRLQAWAMEVADSSSLRDPAWRAAVGMAPASPCTCPSCRRRPTSPDQHELMVA